MYVCMGETCLLNSKDNSAEHGQKSSVCIESPSRIVA